MDSTKLDGLHPTLAAKVQTLLATMHGLGYPMMVTDGLRTLAQQQRIYALGRTVQGLHATLDRPMGSTVTDCDGIHSKSNHQAHADGWGHAVDCTFLDSAGQPSWAERWPWDTYGAEAKKLGLKWGGDFHHTSFGPDRPHIELP